MAGLCALALGLRLAVVVGTGRLAAPEVFEYDTMAINLLEGRGLVFEALGRQYAAFTGPVYPALCAGVYAVTGRSRPAMVLLQAVVSSVIPLVTAAIGRRLFGPAAGLAAGLLVAVHPGFLIYGTKLHPLAVDALLFSLIMWGALATRSPRPSRRRVVGIGVALGLSILSRPTVLALLPVIALWWCAGHPLGPRRAWGALAVVCGTAALVVAPWTARNRLLYHRPVLVQSTAGLSFWKGNNPTAGIGNLGAGGRDVISLAPPALRARLADAPDELAQQAVFWDEGWRFVREQPRAWGALLARKLVAFWTFSSHTGAWYPPWYLGVYRWWHAVTMGLVLLGLWQGLMICSPATRHGVWGVLLFCLGISVVQGLFYVEGRHRWGIEPILFALAGGGLAWLAARVRAMMPGRGA